MNTERKRFSLPWWLAIPLAIIGCLLTIWLGRIILFQIQYGSMPIVAMTGGFPPDCSWRDKVVAWIDTNMDGIRDPGEPALPGVQFHVDKGRGGTESITNSKGEANVSVWLPGCPNERFEIFPEIPPGYRLTTEPRKYADVREFDRTLEFGFVYLPGVPTIAPASRLEDCKSFKIGGANRKNYITDLAIAADGTVWVTTLGNGIVRHDAGQDQLVFYHASDGLASDYVRSVTPARDGAVWFATTEGASRWDGSTWTSYASENGLISNVVYKVAEAADGSIWFATDAGASHLSADRKNWTSYTGKDGLDDDFVNFIGVDKDGSVWLSTLGELSRLVPDTTGNKFNVISYSRTTSDELRIPVGLLNDIETAPDGTAWFGGIEGLMFQDPQTRKWNEVNVDTTEGAFRNGVDRFTFAPDGSMWIAADTEQPVIYHFIRSLHGREAWQIFDQRDGLPLISDTYDYSDLHNAIAVTADNVVWFATLEYVERCNYVTP